MPNPACSVSIVTLVISYSSYLASVQTHLTRGQMSSHTLIADTYPLSTIEGSSVSCSVSCSVIASGFLKALITIDSHGNHKSDLYWLYIYT